jgi:hypothetical protein
MPAKRRLLCKRNRAPHGDPAHRSCDRPGQCRLQPVHIAFQLDLNLDVKRPSLLPDADPEIDVTRPIMEAGLN